MKTKTTVLYNDTEPTSFESMRNYLFNEYAEQERWESLDDIPDCLVYYEIDEERRHDWEAFVAELDSMFDEDCYLLTGVCGRWNGPAEGGKFIHSTQDLLDAIRHLDYIKVYDENGHFLISGYHHDGSDSYELKKLTKKGWEFAYNNYFAHDRYLHTTIMKNNFFSKLPRMAERLYGA